MRGFLVVVLALAVGAGVWLLVTDDATERIGAAPEQGESGPVLLGGAPRTGEAMLDAGALSPARAVTGLVVDEAGEPVAGVFVRAFLDPTPDVPDVDLVSVVERAFAAPFLLEPLQGAAETAADGTFRFDGLPTERVVWLRAEVAAPLYTTTTRVTADLPARIEVREGQRFAPRLGDAPRDAVVIRAGDYLLEDAVCPAAPAGPFEATVYVRGRLHFAQPVHRDGEIRGTPNDSAAVVGTVTSSDGRAIAGARIHVRTGSRRGPLSLPRTVGLATSGSDGGYAAHDLVSGVVQQMIVVAAGYVPREIPVAGRRVEPGERIEIDVVMRRGGTLGGAVVDPEGRPVDGAVVALGRWAKERRATTGADGRFRFDGLPLGELPIHASARGLFQARTPEVVRLDSPDAPLEITIVLSRGAARSGRVVLASGEPAGAGVVVAAHRPGQTFEALPGGPQALTGPDGTFSIAAHKGLVTCFTAFAPGMRSVESAAWIHVPGETPAPLELVLRPTATLAGAVLTTDDEPVEGVYVRLGDSSRGVTTDALGRWQFDGLPPGEQIVLLEDRVFAGWGAGELKVETRTLDWGDVVDDVVLRCSPRSFLSGVVVDADGEPVPGATVACQDTNAGWIHANPGGTFEIGDHGSQTTTDEGGRFRIAGLWGGGIEYEFRVDGIEVPGAKTASDEAVRLEIGKLLERVVEGRVVGKDGTVVETADLTVTPLVEGEHPDIDEYEQIGWTTFEVPAHHGGFRLFVNTEADAVRVVVRNPRGAAGTRLDLLSTKPQDIPLTGEPIVIALEPALEIIGRVVDAAGDGVPGVEVGFAYLEVPDADEWSSSRIASYGPNEGKFEWPYSDDKRTTSRADGRFTFHGVHDSTFYLRTRGRDDYVWRQPIEVEDRAKPVEIRVEAAGIVAGRVVGPDGEPLAGLVVKVAAAAGRDPPEGRTDADGRFEIGGLEPERRVNIDVDHVDTDVRPYLGTSVQDVPVGTTDVEIRLDVGGKLFGVVVDQAGVRILEGQVLARLAGQPSGSEAVDFIDPDFSTSFEIGPLVPGEYDLTLEGSWGSPLAAYRLEPLRVTVPGPPVRLVVRRTWTIAGTLSGLAFPEGTGATIGLQWCPDEPIKLPGDDNPNPFMGYGDDHTVWLGEDRTWELPHVRESEGRLHSWEPGQNKVCVMRVRRGQGPFELAFVDALKIEGRVEGASGQTELLLRQGPFERTISTSADGSFVIAGLLAGTWTLTKKRSPWQPDEGPAPVITVAAGTTDVVYRLR